MMVAEDNVSLEDAETGLVGPVRLDQCYTGLQQDASELCRSQEWFRLNQVKHATRSIVKGIGSLCSWESIAPTSRRATGIMLSGVMRGSQRHIQSMLRSKTIWSQQKKSS